eukprot:8564696-Pyramimonas_sp.AAC.1
MFEDGLRWILTVSTAPTLLKFAISSSSSASGGSPAIQTVPGFWPSPSGALPAAACEIAAAR